MAPSAPGALLLCAALTGASARPAPATGAPAALPASVGAVVGSNREAEALSALEAVGPAELRSLPFQELERFVQRSWWRAARGAVERSHAARVDFTAPVRRAVSATRRGADELLRWLDPRYAHPAPTPMAVRWAQNRTAVVFTARFSSRWEAPGASFAVYTTERGRGHVDMAKTTELVQSLLRVNVTPAGVAAEITAEVGSGRKRFTLSVDVFDEIVPERSPWLLEFRRAQGSMQMSAGAQIPELRLELRKRRPLARLWPRLAAAPAASGPGAPDLAPAAAGGESAGGPEGGGAPPPCRAEASTLVCLARGALHCAPADACVPDCAACAGAAAAAVQGGRRCIGPPRAGAAPAVFEDEDLGAGAVGGALRWSDLGDAWAEEFRVFWGTGADRAPGGPLLSSPAFEDPAAGLRVPQGTALPAGADSLLVVAANAAGEALVASAPVQDRVRPPPLRGLRFADASPRQGHVAGTAELEPPEDTAHVASYELRWARGPAGAEEAIEGGAPLARAEAGAGPAARVGLALSAEIPHEASAIMAFAVGPGGVRGRPVSEPIRDACPPQNGLSGLRAGDDRNPTGGVVSLRLTLELAPSPNLTAQPGGGMSAGHLCMPSSTYAIFWQDAAAATVGAAIAELPAAQGDYPLVNVTRPPSASALTALARSPHGQAPHGLSVRIVDLGADL